jgi:putative acetyltransferase
VSGSGGCLIRAEEPGDAGAIRALLAGAFGRDAEADLVEALGASGMMVVSLVAVESGEIAGYVGFSPVTIDGRTEPVLGLAPLAVRVASRRRGVGGRLVAEGLRACRELGAAGVVVLGDPGYYGRFGFEPALSLGLRCEYEAPEGAFRAVELTAGGLAGRTGLVRYRAEFDAAVD